MKYAESARTTPPLFFFDEEKIKTRSEHVLLEICEGRVDLESLCDGCGTLSTDWIVRKAGK